MLAGLVAIPQHDWGGSRSRPAPFRGPSGHSRAGWSIEHLVREDRVLHEGAGHDGQSDVLEMIARRDRDDRGQRVAPPTANPS